MSYATIQETRYTSVMLDGLQYGDALREARASLELAGLSVAGMGPTSIILQDVPEDQLGNVQTVAASYQMHVAGVYGKKQVLRRSPVQPRKAFQLNLSPNRWYLAQEQQDGYPFVLVRQSDVERDADGNEDASLTLEFYSPDQVLPIKRKLCAQDVAALGLREATEQDFSQLDMILPMGHNLQLQDTMAVSPETSGIPGQHHNDIKSMPGDLNKGRQ